MAATINRKPFKKEFNLEKRKETATRILRLHPDRIPVIVEKDKGGSLLQIKKNKYLVPNDLTLSRFAYEIRNYISIPSDTALFLFVNEHAMPAGQVSLGELYKQHKNEDGFLYITYSGENTFG